MENYEQELLNQLANKIKYQRNKLGISQEKLAEKCNFDRTYISLLERAKRNPSYLSLKKLSLRLISPHLMEVVKLFIQIYWSLKLLWSMDINILWLTPHGPGSEENLKHLH